MRTTFHLFGAALVSSALGLCGCGGFESGGVEVGGAGGSSGEGEGEGGGVSIDVYIPPTRLIHVKLDPGSGSTGTAQGGGGGSTETAQAGSGGSTETAQGGTGGALQTLTTTTETTGSGTVTETSTAGETGTATTPLGSGTETSTGPVVPPTTHLPGPTSAPSETAPYPGMEDSCPGVRYKVDAGEALSIAGTTKDMHDDLSNRCGDGITPSRPDVVYQVELLGEATVDVTLVGMDFLPVLSLRREACQSERYNDLCLASEDIVVHTQLAMAPGVYWFVIDSADGRYGSYWLGVNAAKPVCGDGVVNPRTEECDPGKGQVNDGCFDPESTFGCMYGEKMEVPNPIP